MKRVIPNVLFKHNYAVKGKSFRGHKYVGDLINTVKLFNELEVDELMLTNIGPVIDYDVLDDITSQAFMPLTYSGQINSLETAKKIISCGFEKVALNSLFFDNYSEFKKIVSTLGSQSVSLNLNVKKNIFGKYYFAYDSLNRKVKNFDVVLDFLSTVGIGDLIFNSVAFEGQNKGIDTKLVEKLSLFKFNALTLYSGGVSNQEEFDFIKSTPLDGIVCGRAFVFKGKHDAVLINKPKIN